MFELGKSRLAYREEIHKSTWRKRGTATPQAGWDAAIVLRTTIR
jgi:hypothetical protein